MTLHNKRVLTSVVFAVCVVAAVALAGSVTLPNTFTAGTPAVAAQVNANFAAVKTAVDDNHTRLSTTETQLSALTTRIAALEAAPRATMGYAQSGGLSIPAGTTYDYPLTMNVGTATKCSVSVVGWLSGQTFTGLNQTYVAARLTAGPGSDLGGPAYGCYFAQTSSPWSTCAYTWVVDVTANTSYDFGCRLVANAANGAAYCAVAVNCH